MNELDAGTVQPDVLPVSPSDELWTSDSQRADNAPPEPPAEPEAPEPPVAATPPEVAPEAPVEAKKGKARDNPIVRMQQATAKEAAAKEDARLAREETASLKARLDAIEQERRQPAPPLPRQTAPPSGKPAWKTFEEKIGADYESWGDAQDAYFDAQRGWDRHQQNIERFHGELQTAVQTDPILAQILQRPPPASDVMNLAILQSPQKLAILRHLGTHPEDCTQLARETQFAPADAVPMMRRYLESLVVTGAVVTDSAPVVRPSTANPPINRVGGTASATPVDPDDLPFGPDYIRSENAREKKRQESSRW